MIMHISGPNGSNSSTNDASAWRTLVCGHCQRHVNAAVIAYTKEPPYSTWLRCPACGLGLLIVDRVQYPGPRVGEDVAGLPADVAEGYDEARDCLAAHAFTACELMCRRLLMQVGADKGAQAGKPFGDYLEHLVTLGYITPPMKAWADLIRQRGNTATHKLPPATQEEALRTLGFTTQLLRLVYEMEHKAMGFTAP
jgi:hypothetical protein